MLTFDICKAAVEKACARGSKARVSEKKMIALHSLQPLLVNLHDLKTLPLLQNQVNLFAINCTHPTKNEFYTSNVE